MKSEGVVINKINKIINIINIAVIILYRRSYMYNKQAMTESLSSKQRLMDVRSTSKNSLINKLREKIQFYIVDSAKRLLIKYVT